MAKDFAPRVSKKNRQTLDLAEKFSEDIFKLSDKKLLKDAIIDEIKLSDIVVKDQVRTHFDDNSIRELAKNIQVNGLIQPLVVHRKGFQYQLICGERRYRAMTMVNIEVAPCFVLEGKTDEELMAIQFSENSAREALNYIDKADGIYNYQIATNATERKIVDALGISKSEVHRSLLIAKLSKKIKDAAKLYNIEKYVLVEYQELGDSDFKQQIEEKICSGKITKRLQLRRVLRSGSLLDTPKSRQVKSSSMNQKKTNDISVDNLLKALSSKNNTLALDKKTRELLKSLMADNSKAVD